MMMHTTVAQLRTLKLDGLAGALEEQLVQSNAASMSFEERLALLVDREIHHRNDRRQRKRQRDESHYLRSPLTGRRHQCGSLRDE